MKRYLLVLTEHEITQILMALDLRRHCATRAVPVKEISRVETKIWKQMKQGVKL